MKSIFTFLSLIFISFVGISQVDLSMEFHLLDYTNGKKISGVTVDVIDGTNVVKTASTSSNGIIKLTVPSGKKYKVQFSKPGKVSRFLYIDSKGINAEEIQGGSSVGTGKIEVKLFDEIQGVDFSHVENNQFTEFYFDGNPILPYDKVIAEKMAKKITELLKQAAAKESENDAKYQDAMAKAKDWENKKNWQFALDKYEEASLFKPSEQEPKDKIKELDALLKKQQTEDLGAKQKEEDYQKIIASANALLDQKKYPEAIAKYQEALKLKDEQFIKDQIKDINGYIEKDKKNAENEKKYSQSIKAGDDLVAAKKYIEAKVQYNEALKIKTNDPVATKKLVDLELKINAENANADKKKKYDGVITLADQLLASNKLADAKAKYNEAILLDNTQTYPTTKINEINAKLADEAKNKQKNEQYSLAMKAADDLFNANKLNEAKVKYLEASKIDVSQSKPTENIAKIDKLLSDQAEAKKNKEKSDKIVLLLKEGSGFYGKNDLENAKKKYQEVLNLDASNTEATTKLNEINAKIAANNSEADKIKKFNDLKAKGLELMKQKKWSEAKQAFSESKSYKTDSEIDTKLKEIETKIAEENAKLSADQVYTKTLDEAKSLENTNIDASILKYKEAQKLKPTETIPATKIKELEAKKVANSTQNENDKKYAEAIKKGDELLSSKKYLEAIKSYNIAGTIKPTEKEPAEKSALAEKLSKAEGEGEAKKQYNKILDAGQKALEEKDWTKAREMYNRAIKLDPNDFIPKNKLKEIDSLQKAEEDAKKGNSDKETAYNTKIKDAESAASSKDYDKAISLFNDAKTLKPTEIIPSKRIKELEELKAKNQSNTDLEKKYSEFINKGNSAVNSKDYQLALTEYKNALNVKNNDKIASNKIAEVTKLIENESSSKNDAEFNKIIKDADELFAQEKWIDAKNIYEKALSIKNDSYAKNQYEKCTKNAKGVGEFEKQYQKVISSADKNFESKNYDKAIELYERAISLKATDSYPKDKLNEIKQILNPVVVQPIGPLNNLGVPATEDIAKVNEQLIKDQNTRKSKREIKLKNKKDKIQDKNSETQETKTEEILSANKKISEIEKENAQSYESGDENRQETLEIVKNSNESITEEHTETEAAKYNENLNNTELVKNIVTENSNQYTSSESIYTNNSEKVKTYEQNIENKATVENISAYTKTIENQQDLSKTSKKFDEKVLDDFESRKKIEEDVKATNKNISTNDYTNTTKEGENISELAVKIENEDKIRIAKSTEDSKIYGKNNEILEDVDKSILKTDNSNNTKLVNKSLESDKILALKQKELGIVVTAQDENRTTNVEEIKTGSFDIQNNSREEYNKNVIKNFKSQEGINNVAQNTILIDEKEKINSDILNTALDGIDKKATISNSEINLNDDQQRQKTNDNTTNSKINISNQNTEKSKKVEENISGVQTVSKDIISTTNKAELEKKENLTNAQVLLNKITSKEIKYDNKVANSLGTLYPEGVSQEVFNQNDEDGLLVSVITRRIVVKEGFGQIYIRTQSLNGLTYSKNGEPSSEFVWQKETQDSKLKKNY